MKVRHTLIAAALAVVAAPAFAAGDEVDIYSAWDLYSSVYVSGGATVSGAIPVSSSSGATVDQDQGTIANLSFGDGDNTASAGGDALRGAEGNIGVNIAAGVGNAQANDAALSTVDGANVFASAQVFNTQVTGANFATDLPSGPDNQHFFRASVSDSVLRGASGNIGLNVASGNGNAQSNALAASTNASGSLAQATSDSEQLTALNILLAAIDLDNTASLDGDALRNATGNIGVNVAAGLGNAQHNGLSIAVSD